MAQCHGTMTVMYGVRIGVCVHLFQTMVLQQGTAVFHCRLLSSFTHFRKSVVALYKLMLMKMLP